MDVNGTHEVHASRDDVWALLTDVERLRECGGAIKSVEVLDGKRARVTAKIGGGLFGVTASIHVTLDAIEPRESASLSASGAAAGTQLAATGGIRMSGPDSGPTTINYRATVQLTGGFASMATQMLDREGPKMLAEAFDCLQARLPRRA
ncbi:MAG TPA: SRPBCC domain-containing protein [Candidatus Limnocylindria bacterium]|nr:SRPBCC domain-containing protein [Candidatus Limnocylindria bacterium]